MFRRRIYQGLTAAGLALAVTACKLPELAQRNPNRTTPAAYVGATTDSTNIARTRWRQFFTDPNLVALIDSALQRNQELNITTQELELARNEIRARTGDYMPSVSLGVSSEVEKPGRYTLQGATEEAIDIRPDRRTPTPLANHQIGVFASW